MPATWTSFLLGCAMAGPPSEQSFATAVGQLASFDTWCAGADVLADSGRPDAVLALVGAYDRPAETSKVCLLDALTALGKAGAIEGLWALGTPEARTASVRAMGLVADERWLPTLALAAADPALESVALRSLMTQVRTPPWEATLVGLLGSSSATVRLSCINELARRKAPTAYQALVDHQAHETDPTVLARLAAILGG
jgi:hypothetical protein